MWTWFTSQPWWLASLLGLLGLIVIGVLVFAVFSLVGLPVLALLSRLFSRAENSTTESADDYLLGELTLRIPADGVGEVMITGNGRARQTYAARSYDAGVALPQGTAVVVVAVRQGVAYVQAAKQLPPTTK
ncbi:hypothetical protein [Lacticaseibacillus nasuensis]|uniref:NfeD-like C-terminal domain-containing protein n=1 Tax=Lacticaseibacillus nasuensis JCM 17158 TaxID=1291734 RepID=A0A0R1JZW3_9LACO|nr:hypothetical protein [Lacticaseibacillus nasuensis]KRK73362.1 hypothetical protein FD02_GL001220 [Lacticaseibacillus nasuensis JCM 17158]MCX2455561.1 hypothetical protein [Lacticaseibacillus nasuensis]